MIVSRVDCVYRNCTFNFDRTFFIDFVKFSGEGAGDDVHVVTKIMGDYVLMSTSQNTQKGLYLAIQKQAVQDPHCFSAL